MGLILTSTKNASNDRGIKSLIYGKAGAGKTFLASTAPDPLMLSAEAGVLSLRHHDITMLEIATIQDLVDAHAWLEGSAEARQTYQTIFIDSISEIGEVVLANAKKQVKDPRQAYGELIEKMMMLIRAFRDLSGFNVVMIAKQEPVKDEMTGVVVYSPSMPGVKLGNQLPYLFDEVFRLGIGKTKEGVEYRFLQTQPDMQYEAKDRSGALDAIEQPDLTHIFNKIRGDI
jgi:phage nucleotide-binding protein